MRAGVPVKEVSGEINARGDALRRPKACCKGVSAGARRSQGKTYSAWFSEALLIRLTERIHYDSGETHYS
jgi:hypothetical protein